jgi:hypothetical protein
MQLVRHSPDGSPDIRKDVFGNIYFWSSHRIRAYKKEDSPPKWVKPIPIIIIIFLLAQAYGQERDDGAVAIADIITITIYYLLHAGEYMGATSDDAAFWIEDVALYIQDRRLDSMTVTAAVAAADLVA